MVENGVLWLRLPQQRPVVEAHLRHVRGRFRAAGWRIAEGTDPPEPAGALAVMDEPWAEPLPEVVTFLAGAEAPGQWRLPRVNGGAGAQDWPVPTGPYTAFDYERMARPRGTAAVGVPAPADAWRGFAVAAAEDAEVLLAAGWPPGSGSTALVPEARLYCYADPAAHDRRELDPHIPSSARTLVDVGCGHGLLGARHRGTGRRVIGVEPDWDLAREASRRLDLVLPLGAEDAFEALRPEVDCMVFADVLEHTADAAGVLDRAARVLAPAGRIVASLPNTAWVPVLRALAAGRWDPTLAGVQARDHLAVMTPDSFRRLAAECGLRVTREIPVEVPLPRWQRWWSWLLARSCGGSPRNLLAMQWIAILEK